MIYKLHNQSESVMNLDNEEIFNNILERCDANGMDDDDLLELMKDITRDSKKLHELAVEMEIDIYDILLVIVHQIPDLVDKRFLNRMRKLYNRTNPKSNG